MVTQQSSRKLIIVSLLSIIILGAITFGTLAFFRQTDSATGIIGVGSNIAISTTNTTVQITDLTTATNKSVGSTVTKTAGVKAKLRVYVNVSLVDSSGNLQSVTYNNNGTTSPYFTINMASISGAQWVDGPHTNSAGSCWKYLMTANNSSVAFEVATDTPYTLCESITVNQDLSETNFRVIVTTSVEVLQYNNVAWDGTSL